LRTKDKDFFFLYPITKRHVIPAVCWGLIPIPSSVIIAEVAGGTLNSSAANLSTAVNGVFSGTLNLHEINPSCRNKFICAAGSNETFCQDWQSTLSFHFHPYTTVRLGL